MNNYLEKIKKALKEKTGIDDVSSLEYKYIPESNREYFNASLAIGNINLTAGRFKTEKEANELIDEFLKTPLP